jgi:hypothetical protein
MWQRALKCGLCDPDEAKWIVCSRRNGNGRCVWQSKAKEGLSVADEAKWIVCVAKETKREAVCGRVRQRRACLLQIKP